MRAVQFDSYGPPSVLHVAEVPEPHAGPGQIRISVRASGVSAGEMLIRSGTRRDTLAVEFPYRTGFDAAGVVDEVGEGAPDAALGEEVFGYVDGTVRGANADYAILVAWAPKPRAWSWEEAGGAAGGVETATRVLDRLEVGAGDTVLVQGASGATGMIVAQIAAARGARVIGTASERNHEFVSSLGATPTAYGPGLVDRMSALAPGGVSAVVDCAGGALSDLVAIAGAPERVVTIADLSAKAHGVHLSHGAPPEHAAALGIPADPPAVHGLAAAGPLAEAGRLRIPVAAVFPLAEPAAAGALSEASHDPGRIVLVN